MSTGSLQSLDWNGGMEWNTVEYVLWGERSLLTQFSIKVTPVEGVRVANTTEHGLLFRTLTV